MENKENCFYFDITQKEKDSAIRYLLGSIIKCRRDSNFPSNQFTFDEDVNVYLAHLLFAVSLPEYHEMAEPYLSIESSDVMKAVQATEDRTIRYFIFKVNADHILIHSAVFGDLEGKSQQKFFKRSGKHFSELAKLYYDQAASYHNRIYRKKTGVGDVLEKLSRYFDAYQGLLKVVRREYFGFVNSFRDQVFGQFMYQMKKYESDITKKGKMDQFLDLYAQWMKTKDPAVRAKIEDLVTELKYLDPHFEFDLQRIRRGVQDERECA